MSTMDEKWVLDHGFVRLVDRMGNDLSIIRAARVSYNAPWRAGDNEENDRRLMQRLWTGGKSVVPCLPAHSTPFESVTLTFEVKAPIFVFRQWHRHRTQSYNELSARYKELPEEFYCPKPEIVGIQSKDNKQGRDTKDQTLLSLRDSQLLRYREACKASIRLYKEMLASDWPKELARCVLPVSMYSHMFTTMNLLNFFKFAMLRSDAHAQYEIRQYSNAMLQLVESVAPTACGLFYAGNPDVKETLNA